MIVVSVTARSLPARSYPSLLFPRIPDGRAQHSRPRVPGRSNNASGLSGLVNFIQHFLPPCFVCYCQVAVVGLHFLIGSGQI